MQKTSSKYSSQGFTLVELLVVIAILGILIVALIASLDPLEQIRRGNDSARRTSATQLQNAVIRFYSNHGAFPWSSSVGGTPCGGGAFIPSSAAVISTSGTPSTFESCLTGSTVVTNLVSQGDLKDNFKSQPNMVRAQETPSGSALYATQTTDAGANAVVVICFDPESRSESSKSDTKYNKLGDVVASCPNNTAPPSGCYQCVR